MVQTGTSQNITYYAERGQRGAYLWAEVVRNDHQRGPGGFLVHRPVPTFGIYVKRARNEPVTEFIYEPKRRPSTTRLSPVTVARLIRAELAGQP
jgi:hypothetical protein